MILSVNRLCIHCGKTFLAPLRRNNRGTYRPRKCSPCEHVIRKEKIALGLRKSQKENATRWARIHYKPAHLRDQTKWYNDPKIYWFYCKQRENGIPRDEARAAAVKLWNEKQRIKLELQRETA